MSNFNIIVNGMNRADEKIGSGNPIEVGEMIK